MNTDPTPATPAPEQKHVHQYAWSGLALIRDGLQIATFESSIPADMRSETTERLNAALPPTSHQPAPSDDAAKLGEIREIIDGYIDGAPYRGRLAEVANRIALIIDGPL